MDNTLLETLEDRVISTVELVEQLQREVQFLRNERQMLEGKIKALIERIQDIEKPTEAANGSIEVPSGEFHS